MLDPNVDHQLQPQKTLAQSCCVSILACRLMSRERLLHAAGLRRGTGCLWLDHDMGQFISRKAYFYMDAFKGSCLALLLPFVHSGKEADLL